MGFLGLCSITRRIGINGAQRVFLGEKIKIKGCSWLEVVSGERDIAREVSSGLQMHQIPIEPAIYYE